MTATIAAELPARIAAIYTSGKHSIHALLRIDAKSKEDFDAIAKPLKRPLKVLGADPACLQPCALLACLGAVDARQTAFRSFFTSHPNHHKPSSPTCQNYATAAECWPDGNNFARGGIPKRSLTNDNPGTNFD
jgi:hypothetical protein